MPPVMMTRLSSFSQSRQHSLAAEPYGLLDRVRRNSMLDVQILTLVENSVVTGSYSRLIISHLVCIQIPTLLYNSYRNPMTISLKRDFVALISQYASSITVSSHC